MSFLDNSSDDDCYINSANQLKALKENLNAATNLSEVDTLENISSSQSFEEDFVASSNFIPQVLESSDPPNQSSVQRKSGRATRNSKKNQQRQQSIDDAQLPAPPQPRRSKRATRNSNKDFADELLLATRAFINEMAKAKEIESKGSANANEAISLTDSDDDEDDVTVKQGSDDDTEKNYEISVKINWRSTKLERFSLRKYQQFSKVFEYFSAMENIPQDRVWLMLRNEKQVQPSDTPDSLGITIVDILEGGIVDTASGQKTAVINVDKDSINIKVQMKDRKETLNMFVKKTQKIKALISMCAEQLEIPEEKIKLHFDGESVNPNETPDSLDLEGGECFDMHTLP